MAFSPRARVLLLSASILFGLTALVWYLSSRPRPMPVTPIPQPNSTGERGVAPSPPSGATPHTGESAPPPPSDASTPAVEASSSPSSTPTPYVNSAPPASPAPPPPADAANSPTTNLLIPVAGVRPEQLQDTYTQSRSEGRTHNAIDIMAARNTPVLAAADGRIIKLFQSERGGITLYQLGTDNRTVYYYAHLERYADGVAENRFARRGELLGYVGDSGNAGRDNCHLHFSVWLVTDPKRFWDGENLNPYPLLTKR
ncbi:MAG TPA: peptidoglycan DD-metalloendopeptidase family protein [Pyrinomonadaceae bacterium]|nr:peptidoglycan DD-metalloendopeptidase family protein [Pyrinomonadaceae bacterium]